MSIAEKFSLKSVLKSGGCAVVALMIGTSAAPQAEATFFSHTGTQVAETVQNLNALQGQIVQLYSSQSSYGTAPMTQTLIQAGIAPSRMVLSSGATTVLRHEWGSMVEVVPTGGGTGFRISLANVPQKACISLLQTMMGDSNNTGLRGATVLADLLPKADDPVLMAPIDTNTASTSCSSPDVNGMSFYYQ